MLDTKAVFEKISQLTKEGKLNYALKLLSESVKTIADKGKNDVYIQRSLFLVKKHPDSNIYSVKGALTHLEQNLRERDSWSLCQKARLMMDSSLSEHYDPVGAEDILRDIYEKEDEARYLLGHLHASGMQNVDGTPIYDYQEASSQLIHIIEKGESEWYLPSIMKLAEISTMAPGESGFGLFEVASYLRPFIEDNKKAKNLYSGLLISELENVASSEGTLWDRDLMVFEKMKKIFMDQEDS
jgi:hypothetical protein